MAFSNYLRDELLDEVWGGEDFTPPTSVYVGLSTTTPNDDGTNVSEPSGGSYARVETTNNLTNWPAATDGVKENGAEITFPQATASWGTVTHVVMYDADTGGNFLGFGALTTSKSIENGDTAKFNANDMTITLS